MDPRFFGLFSEAIHDLLDDYPILELKAVRNEVQRAALIDYRDTQDDQADYENLCASIENKLKNVFTMYSSWLEEFSSSNNNIREFIPWVDKIHPEWKKSINPRAN